MSASDPSDDFTGGNSTAPTLDDLLKPTAERLGGAFTLQDAANRVVLPEILVANRIIVPGEPAHFIGELQSGTVMISYRGDAYNDGEYPGTGKLNGVWTHLASATPSEGERATTIPKPVRDPESRYQGTKIDPVKAADRLDLPAPSETEPWIDADDTTTKYVAVTDETLLPRRAALLVTADEWRDYRGLPVNYPV